MTKATNNGPLAIVLAAGSATRFGSTKQLAEVRGVPLVKRAVDTANAAFGSRVILVVGHDWQAVCDACAPSSGFIIVHERFSDGMGTSLSRAVRTVRHAAPAMVLMLADQVLVTAQHLNTLVQTWCGADDEIVATAYAGSIGAPVLFASGCFDALTELDGDLGARQLLRDDRFRLRSVTLEDAAVDIDTPEDLQLI